MGQLQEPAAPPDLGGLCVNIIFLLLGIYGWEYVQSLHVEWALVCRRLAFRLSLIPYILGRTSLLIFLILLAAGTSPFSRGVSCLPGTLAIVSLGSITLGCSSTNFVIRTWVIWKDSRIVHAFLLLLALGQWTLLVLDVVIVKTMKDDCVCIVYPTYPQLNGVTLIYTTFFDLVVLVLSVLGLSTQRCESPLKRRLRAQGIMYFAVAGIAYIPPMVFALLNDTSVYNLVSNTALTASTIVSSRAVRSLFSLDTCHSNEDTDIALTTQIRIQPTIAQESTTCGRQSVDEASPC